MELIVKKFGGSCLADRAALQNAADIISKTCESGAKVIAVVSAQGTTTDQLSQSARALSAAPSARELDAVMSAGEQLSAALLAIAVNETGRSAVSLLGWQAGILTNGVSGGARIQEIDVKRIEKELRTHDAVVVAGFQGVDRGGNMTTLGRGGSDTTAVAVAAAFGASRCEIYSRIDGIYTADPAVLPEAVKLREIDYGAMQELAFLGVKVLNPRAVELAQKYGVVLEVRSAFSDAEGTIIRENANMEKMLISGVTKKSETALLRISGLRDSAAAFHLFGLLASAYINVDIILQSAGGRDGDEIAFTVDKENADEAVRLIRESGVCDDTALFCDKNVSKVSVVGVGMESHHGVAKAIFEALSKEKINVLLISSSELRFSVVVKREDADRTVRAIHRVFINV